MEGTLILQKGETKASPLLALGPVGENHYRHGLRSQQGGYPRSATPSPNWPRGAYQHEPHFIHSAAPPQFPSCQHHVFHTPKPPSPELQTHTSSGFRKISSCKSHRQLKLKMFRTKHCHHSNACSASCISSWFTEASQLRTAKSEFWKTTDTSLSPISTSNWPLSSLSLELSFLSLLPLPGYPLSLRQPPVACCFQVTMPMSELPSMHFPQQWRGHLAKTQGWPTFPLPKTPKVPSSGPVVFTGNGSASWSTFWKFGDRSISCHSDWEVAAVGEGQANTTPAVHRADPQRNAPSPTQFWKIPLDVI